jgi:putative MATE family efflux protein
MMLRGTESVKVPMLVSAFALSCNTLLGYGLIFGRLGLPEMGIRGAAVAFAVSRLLEVVTVSAIISLRAPYNHMRPIFQPGREILRRYLRTTLPVAVNELAWALGMMTYTSIYAHIGTESVTATSITSTIENLAFVPFLALGNATAILVGKKIGAGEPEMAYAYGQRSLKINLLLAFFVSAALLVVRGPILGIYQISDAARANAQNLILALAIALPFKSSNFASIVGVLRAGGDTRYTLMMEFATMWLYGVPAALIAAAVLHLPVYYVILFVYSEELIKLALTLRRFRSRRWVHHLAADLA